MARGPQLSPVMSRSAQVSCARSADNSTSRLRRRASPSSIVLACPSVSYSPANVGLPLRTEVVRVARLLARRNRVDGCVRTRRGDGVERAREPTLPPRGCGCRAQAGVSGVTRLNFGRCVLRCGLWAAERCPLAVRVELEWRRRFPRYAARLDLGVGVSHAAAAWDWSTLRVVRQTGSFPSLRGRRCRLRRASAGRQPFCAFVRARRRVRILTAASRDASEAFTHLSFAVHKVRGDVPFS